MFNRYLLTRIDYFNWIRHQVKVKTILFFRYHVPNDIIIIVASVLAEPSGRGETSVKSRATAARVEIDSRRARAAAGFPRRGQVTNSHATHFVNNNNVDPEITLVFFYLSIRSACDASDLIFVFFFFHE